MDETTRDARDLDDDEDDARTTSTMRGPDLDDAEDEDLDDVGQT